MAVLETGRLALRRIIPDDAPFILELLNEPSFLEFIGDKGVRNLDDARRYILTGPVASYERFGFGLYLVLLKVGDTPIGMCGLVKRETLPDVDVGYALRPAYWRQGYAFEAASAVLTHGREAFGLRRIVAITSPGNAGSKALLEKLGLRFEQALSLPGSGDIHLFAVEM
ncbi:MAG: Ribosomal-protein-alanine acetyltransferase [Gemmatimonadetes bacterium]|nr:Ribosomal-protein-alanine acetyltransferase [Gemmatimonadota bacterium]